MIKVYFSLVRKIQGWNDHQKPGFYISATPPLTHSFYAQNCLTVTRWSLQSQPSSLWSRHQENEKGKDQRSHILADSASFKVLSWKFHHKTAAYLSWTTVLYCKREWEIQLHIWAHCYTQQYRNFITRKKGKNLGGRIKTYLKMNFRKFCVWRATYEREMQILRHLQEDR